MDSKWWRAACVTIVVAGGGWLCAHWGGAIFYTLLPFVLAWLPAYGMQAPARYLHRHLHLPLGLCRVVLVYASLSAVFALLFFGIQKTAAELLSAADRLLQEQGETYWRDLWEQLPGFMRAAPGGERVWQETCQALCAKAGEAAVALSGRLCTALPLWGLFLLVSLVAAYYFAADLDTVHQAISHYLPPAATVWLRRLTAGAIRTALGYLRTYLLLLGMTFLLLLAGLLILKIRYAVLLALVIALLDLLPVIGTGTLLLPLSVLFFAQGDAWRGCSCWSVWWRPIILRRIWTPSTRRSPTTYHRRPRYGCAA